MRSLFRDNRLLGNIIDEASHGEIRIHFDLRFLPMKFNKNSRDSFKTSFRSCVALEPRLMLAADAGISIAQSTWISIRAAGDTGEESMQLRINDEVVATWHNVGGNPQTRDFSEFGYQAAGDVNADQIRIVYINDQYVPGILDRNLHVDNISLDGRIIETESPLVYSTGTWRPGVEIAPGQVESETLHANGFFQFAEPDANHLIEIHAAGQTGTETMQLLIDGEVVNQWTDVGGNIESREFQTFHHGLDEPIAANRIRVQFVNDLYEPGFDRNLMVDRIVVDGVAHQAEDESTFSTGTWTSDNGFKEGYQQSEWLNGNGYLQFAAGIRNYDGSGNNLNEPEWGRAGAELIRVAPAQYADGVSEIGGQDRPNPREISNEIVAQDQQRAGNSRALSVAVHVWGQFIDHDLSLTEPPPEGGESANIQVPTGDRYFDPYQTGTVVLPFTRSEHVEGTGTDSSNPRQHANAITSYIDGSMVYGSDEVTAANLREFSNGRLRTSGDSLMPKDESGDFIAGDIRAMENVNLTAMHTLFVREHNYWAEQIQQASPDLDDESIYQEARKIVIAEIQAITYNEFLPALLGGGAIAEYSGYDSSVDPGIATEFSTAAFRVGHTMLNDEIRFIDNDGNEVSDAISLADAFFNPKFIDEQGIDTSLKFIASMQAQEIDNQIVDGLRNFLFGPPGAGGLDLASLNIMRGRDHGLADYNTTREAYGLHRVSDFYEVTSNVDVQNKLRELYGTVNNMDLWVAGLAEDHVGDSSVGETFRAIISDQFERVRDGDRFWYQNQLSESAAFAIHQTTLADIIRRNSSIQNIQDDVFLMWGAIEGELYAGSDDRDSLGFPLEGVLLELYDSDGNLVATTHSDDGGAYRFDQIIAVGAYRVVMQLPAEYSTTGNDYNDVWFSRANLTLNGVDFHVPDAEQFLA